MAGTEPQPFNVRHHLLHGHVIPAHPLALTASRTIDERSQRALTRYYVAAGAGGMAVGVHTTGFPIHEAKFGLYQPVLALAAETATAALHTNTGTISDAHAHPFVRVAGLVGNTHQAVREADIARELGYHCGLVSLGALASESDSALIAHCRRVSEHLPIIGFYLQLSVGGRVLSYPFWREFAEIANVVAIKVAPFNRYATLDVVRAIADAGRDDIALYTGNDDAIVTDLVTRIPTVSGGRVGTRHFVGGLLGQWAVWTKHAVQLHHDIRTWHAQHVEQLPAEWLTRGAALTSANAAIFDAANGFAGCLPGILEVLRRQGLVRGTWTLDTHEGLSPGQSELISRVMRDYPMLVDDKFVNEHRDSWLC